MILSDPKNDLRGPLPLISVVVPCRNEKSEILAFLENVSAQEGVPGKVEVLIADGMSDDGTRVLIKSYIEGRPGYVLLDNHGLTAPTGLNLAIRAAKGQYIARMDVHTEYAPDYLSQCLEVARKTGAANVGGAARTRVSGGLADAISAAYGSPFAVGNASFHFDGFEGEVDTVPYGFWSRSLFDDVGYFDETLVRNQDDEFNFRLKRKGLKIWQSSTIVSWYKPRDSFGRLFRQYYQYGYWKTRVIRKYGAPASPRHLVPALFILSLLACIVLGFFIPFFHALLGVEILAYVLFISAGSLLAVRTGGLGLFTMTLVAIMVFHVSYGLGFLAGIISIQSRGASGPDSLSR